MSEKQYTSGSQERGYRVLILLAGNEFNGLAPGEIAKTLATNPSNITRDLSVLQAVGLAEQIQETGRWRLGPKVVQIAVAFQRHLASAQARVSEIEQRYTRDPH